MDNQEKDVEASKYDEGKVIRKYSILVGGILSGLSFAFDILKEVLLRTEMINHIAYYIDYLFGYR